MKRASVALCSVGVPILQRCWCQSLFANRLQCRAYGTQPQIVPVYYFEIRPQRFPENVPVYAALADTVYGVKHARMKELVDL